MEDWPVPLLVFRVMKRWGTGDYFNPSTAFALKPAPPFGLA